MEMSDIVYFDLKTGQFWVPWYNMGKGGWFDNIGLAALGSFKFKLVYDFDPLKLDAQPDIMLTAINDDSIADGHIGTDTIIDHGAGVYELVADSGTLDGYPSLEFDFEPFYAGTLANGNRHSYIGNEEEGGHINGGDPVTVTHIELGNDDTLRFNSVDILAPVASNIDDSVPDTGWYTPGTASYGSLRVVQYQDGSREVQWKDGHANEHTHTGFNSFEIVRNASSATPEFETQYDVRFVPSNSTIHTGAVAVDLATDTGGMDVPIAGSASLYGLMPLDGEGLSDGNDGYAAAVTPTHVAKAGGGDWNTASTWESGTVPGDGAIVHIPMGVEITASDDVSSGSHIFLVRVDGTLTFEAPGGAQTKMVVDTIFSTHHGTLNINADSETDGAVDIAVTPFDIEAHKDAGGWSHDADTAAYYSDGATVSLNNTAIGTIEIDYSQEIDLSNVVYANRSYDTAATVAKQLELARADVGGVRAATNGDFLVYKEGSGEGDFALALAGQDFSVKAVTELSVAELDDGWRFVAGEGGLSNIEIYANHSGGPITEAEGGLLKTQAVDIGNAVWNSYKNGGDTVLDGWFQVEDDGAGVLGRYNWDASQLSLGIITHGATHIRGFSKSEIESVGSSLFDESTGVHTLTLEEAPANWKPGDSLLLHATVGRDTETGDFGDVTGEIISVSGNVVTFASAELDADDFILPDGYDLSLTVANVTRNITIHSSVGDDVRSVNYSKGTQQEGQYGSFGDASDENLITQRGHVMFMHNQDVTVDNATFIDLGRTDKSALIDDFNTVTVVDGQGVFDDGRAVPGYDRTSGASPADEIINMRGRYTAHIHQNGVTPDGDFPTVIQGSVAHGGVGWGFVQHGSEAFLIDNIAYDMVGTGFMAETGDETGIWYNNLAVGITDATPGLHNDPPTAAQSNDVARDGEGFWFEGRALAAIGNIAASVDARGYMFQSFGVDQVSVYTAAYEEYDDIFATLGIDRSTFDGLSAFYDGGDTVLRNGLAPISHFADNAVFGAGKGLAILTDNEHGARKLSDAWSHIEGFTAVNTGKGIEQQYAGRYVFDGAKLVNAAGWDSAGYYGTTFAFDILAAGTSNTIVDYSIAGFDVELRTSARTAATGIKKLSMQTDATENDFEKQVTADEPVYGMFGLPEQYAGLLNWDSDGDGIDDLANPYYNLFDLNIIADNSEDFLVDGERQGPKDTVYVENAEGGQTITWLDGNIQAPAGAIALARQKQFLTSEVTDTNKIEITSIQDMESDGMVAIWREHMSVEQADGTFYSSNGVYGANGNLVLPGTDEWDMLDARLAAPLVSHNDIWNDRQYGYNPGTAEVNGDIWSGLLLEFDRQDSLGTLRFSNESLILAYDSTHEGSYDNLAKNVKDLNGDGVYDTVLGDDVIVDDQWDGTTFVGTNAERDTILGTLDTYRRFEFQTSNERVILTPEVIANSLAKNGYATVNGMDYTDQNGNTVSMKFVEVDVVFTDRLDASHHTKTFFVALDEAWGDDDPTYFEGMPSTEIIGRSDLAADMIVSSQYGHFYRGVLQDEPIALPAGIKTVDGTDDRDIIDINYLDKDGESISDDAEVVLAGAHDSDVVWGSGGADTLDGGDGNNDRLHYDASSESVHLDISAEGNVQSGGQAQGDVLTGFEVYNLSNHDDTFLGSEDADIVWPRGGVDRVETNGGDDSIRVKDNSYKAGGANEGQVKVFEHYIDGGAGYDSVSLKGGHKHSLTLTGDRDAETNIVDVEQILGHHADDYISVSQVGGSAQDQLALITGGSGNDTLSVTLNTVTLEGGSGIDRFEVNAEGYDFGGTMDVVISDFDLDSEVLNWRGVTIDLMNLAVHPNISVSYDVEDAGKTILTDADGSITLEGVIAPEPTAPVLSVDGDQDPGNLNDIIDVNYLADPEGHRVTNGGDVLIGGLGNDLLMGNSGNDTYVFSVGDGQDRIYDTGGIDTIEMAGINAADVSFSVSGNDMLISYNNGADRIEVDYQVHPTTDRYKIESFVFADTVLTADQAAARAITDQSDEGNNTVTGTGGDDVIEGFGGDDVLMGNSGNDTYVFSVGDGQDRIYDTGGIDTIEMAGINAADVSFSVSGNDMLISYNNGADRIEVDYQVHPTTDRYKIESFVFADTVLTADQAAARAITDQSDEGNNTVTGTGGDDVIEGFGGDDVLMGNSGNDTYVFSVGDGQDRIYDTGGIDTIEMAGINAADVSFSVSGNDMLISYNNGADRIEVDYQVHPTTDRYKIESFVFADTVLTADQAAARAITDQSDEGNNTVTGTGGDDVIEGFGGDDVLVGNSGNDTYVFSVGDGQDRIYDFGGIDTIEMAGINATDVSFSVSGNDMLISYNNGADRIEVDYQVHPTTDRYKIESFVFADTVLTADQAAARAITDQSDEGNNTVTGTGGDDVIEGFGGDDVLVGRGGSDTFVFAVGDGTDVIADYSISDDQIQFSGLQFADLTISQSSSDVLIEYGATDLLRLNYQTAVQLTEEEFIFV